MAINVVAEVRTTRHMRSAHRTRSVPVGITLVVVAAAAGYLEVTQWLPTGPYADTSTDYASAWMNFGIVAFLVVIAVLSGVPLLTFGLPRRLAIGFGFLVTPVTAISVFGGFAAVGLTIFGNSRPTSELLTEAGTLLAIALALAWFSQRMIRNSRYLLLFLRKFGFTEATSQVSDVVRGRTGSVWRAVTLDDSRVASIDATRTQSTAWLLGGGLALGFCLICCLGFWFSVPRIRIGVATGFCAMVVAVLVVSGVGAAVSARRVKKEQRVVVDRAEAVAPTVKRILRRNRRVLAPRMVVCRVADSQWQAMVLALAQRADAVLVDVSQPSEPVVWEITTLQAAQAENCVYVCHASAVESLLTASPGDMSYTGQVARLLDGKDVLVYSADNQTFGTSLRHRLDEAALRRGRRPLRSAGPVPVA